VVHRHDLRPTLARLCRLLTRAPALEVVTAPKTMPVAVDTPADVASEGAASVAPQA
jgi:acetyl-CoA carboxylase carboxyl transferase subunit beta